MIHTALHHDKIVENQDPDFALVEIEAEKIASEAIRALKESRKYCQPAESGVPNLMGVKFGGKISVPTSNQANGSKSLLERIKLRNQGIRIENNNNNTKSSSSPDDQDSSGDEEDSDLKKAETSPNPIDRSIKMSKMIQSYMTKKAKRFNRASTEQIVDYFKDKLTKSDSAKFKAVLKQICDFDKTSRVWSLKDEHLI